MKRIITACLIIFSLLFSSLACWGEEAAREALFGSSGGKSAWETLVGNDTGSASNSAESARDYLFGESTSLTGKNGASPGKKSAKQELTYKGIPLRMSKSDVKKYLANAGIVPLFEFESKMYEKNSSGIQYQFKDNIAGIPVNVAMQFRWTGPNEKNSPSILVSTAATYAGKNDSEETLQSIHGKLLKYLTDTFGDIYKTENATVIWNDFKNNNDELSLSCDADNNILIKYSAKDEEKTYRTFLELNEFAYGHE